MRRSMKSLMTTRPRTLLHLAKIDRVVRKSLSRPNNKETPRQTTMEAMGLKYEPNCSSPSEQASR